MNEDGRGRERAGECEEKYPHHSYSSHSLLYFQLLFGFFFSCSYEEKIKCHPSKKTQRKRGVCVHTTQIPLNTHTHTHTVTTAAPYTPSFPPHPSPHSFTPTTLFLPIPSTPSTHPSRSSPFNRLPIFPSLYPHIPLPSCPTPPSPFPLPSLLALTSHPPYLLHLITR